MKIIFAITLMLMTLTLTLPATAAGKPPCRLPENATGKWAIVEDVVLDRGLIIFKLRGYKNTFRSPQPDPLSPEGFSLPFNIERKKLIALVNGSSATLYGPAEEGTAGKFDEGGEDFCLAFTE